MKDSALIAFPGSFGKFCTGSIWSATYADCMEFLQVLCSWPPSVGSSDSGMYLLSGYGLRGPHIHPRVHVHMSA